MTAKSLLATSTILIGTAAPAQTMLTRGGGLGTTEAEIRAALMSSECTVSAIASIPL